MSNNIENNLRLSFSYVKKDLLKVNEQMEFLNEKIQHLSMNHATLLGELAKLQNQLSAKKKTSKKSKAKPKGAKPKKKVVKETITYS